MSKYAGWFIVPGLKFVYILGSFIASPIFLAKFIPIITSSFCVALIFLIGNAINGSRCGVIAAISFICVSWFFRYRQMFGSADAEEFSLVLMLFFIYFLIKKKYGKLTWVILLQTIFYPPLLIISLISISILFVYRYFNEGGAFLKNNKKVILNLLIAFTISCCFLFFKYQQTLPEFLGPTLSLEEVMKIEDFKPGARNAIFGNPDTLISRAIKDTTGIGLDLPKKLLFGVICFLVVFPFRIKEKKEILMKMPIALWIFVLSGVIMCIVANLFLFKFYEPSRFIQNPSTIFIVLFAANYVIFLMDWFKIRRYEIISRGIFILYLSILIIMLVPRFGCHKENVKEFTPTILFLSAIPENSFVAGHPKQMNGIGIYAKRRVFLTYKLSTEIYWSKYYNEMTKRTKSFFKAYYSDNIEDVLKFTKKYGITHLIVDTVHFSDDYIKNGEFYFEPFNQYIQQLTSNKNYYYLMNLPKNSILYRDQNMLVVDCKILENLSS